MYSLNGKKGTRGIISLLDDEEVQNGHKIITRAETISSNRYYGYDIDLLTKILNGKLNSKKCYHEIIPAHSRQKMRYDIDYYPKESDSLELSDLMRECCLAIIKSFGETGYPIELEDIMIMDSSNKEKYSMHIVIDRYYVCNNTQASRLFQITLGNCSLQVRQAFDSGVYRSNQSFRMVNCYKLGTERRLTLLNEWECDGKRIFRKSSHNPIIQCLVTCVTGCDEMIVPMLIKDEIRKNTSLGELGGFSYSISDSDVDRLAILHFGDTFKIERKDNFFDLLRQKPSECIACSREHEHENARLYFNPSGIYYRCWRNESSIRLDSIDSVCPVREVEYTDKHHITDKIRSDLVKKKINLETGLL